MWQPVPQLCSTEPWLSFGRRESYPDPAVVYAACAVNELRSLPTNMRARRHIAHKSTDAIANAKLNQRPTRLRIRALTIPLNGGPLERMDDDEVFVISPTSAHQQLRRIQKTSRSKSCDSSRVECLTAASDRRSILNRRQLVDPVDCGDALHAGIMRRASEQTMRSYLKLYVDKQRLRSCGRRQQSNKAGADFTALHARTVEVLHRCCVSNAPSRRHSSCDAHGLI